MQRCLAVFFLLTTLPGCIAAIGNTGAGWRNLPASAKPLLQERVEAARRIMELRQQHLDYVKSQYQSGRVDQMVVNDAEVAVEEARIRLLDYRTELMAVEERKPD